MKQLLKEIKEEVVLLFSDYSFTASKGAYLEGELAGIEIVPKRWNRSSLCDLHLRVIPARISSDVPAEVLAGARKAAVEAQFHRDPNVRFAARHFLQSLRDEPVNPGDLEGMEVQLHFRDPGEEEISLEGTTDRNGEIWFRDVSETALCIVTVGQREEKISLPQHPSSVADKQALTAEPSPEPPLQVQPGSEPQILYLADRRIVALLEEIVGGNALLILETHDEDFNGATVRFEWGNEKGEITLEPGSAPGTWNGQRKLNELFKKLVLTVPTFEVMPRQQED